jgi:transposase-like protein
MAAIIRVHLLRNLLARVPKGNAEMVAAAVRTIFAQPDDQHVHSQLDVISGMLGKQFPVVEVMLQEAADYLLAFAAFPVRHWKKIWSTDPLERVNKEASQCWTGSTRWPRRWLFRVGDRAESDSKEDLDHSGWRGVSCV